jgi:hypothetical protein
MAAHSSFVWDRAVCEARDGAGVRVGGNNRIIPCRRRCRDHTSSRRFPREAGGDFLRRPFFRFVLFGADLRVSVSLPDNVSKIAITLSRSAISTRSLSMLFSRFMFSSTPLIARKQSTPNSSRTRRSAICARGERTKTSLTLRGKICHREKRDYAVEVTWIPCHCLCYKGLRCLLLGGTVTISSTLGKGTTASPHAGLQRRCGVRKHG